MQQYYSYRLLKPGSTNTLSAAIHLFSTMFLILTVSGFLLSIAEPVKAQTVVIPTCPSTSDFPKKGILDIKKDKKECEESDSKKEDTSKEKSKDKKKPKKS